MTPVHLTGDPNVAGMIEQMVPSDTGLADPRGREATNSANQNLLHILRLTESKSTITHTLPVVMRYSHVAILQHACHQKHTVWQSFL